MISWFNFCNVDNQKFPHLQYMYMYMFSNFLFPYQIYKRRLYKFVVLYMYIVYLLYQKVHMYMYMYQT